MGALEGSDLGEEVQLEILQRLAYALVLSGRTEMDVETAEGIVERGLPTISAAVGQGDAGTVLRTLMLRSGLLRQPAEGVTDFVHRTFQDYLGARYAVEEGHLDVLTSHADNTQWEDVIRMAVAHARPRERVVVLRQLLARDEPRLTLLALACLEHATALDPGVRTEVETRASALIPPRTREDAHALAGAGPLVLELLPGPEGLTDEEARAVTITASVLGTAEPDGALAVLRRFRDHRSLDVRRQLAGTWDRFDTREYAVEVLDHLPRDDLFVVCTSPEHLEALRLMRPWHSLTIEGSFPLGEIINAVGDPDTVDVLTLQRNETLSALDELPAFRSLNGLGLKACPDVRDLGRLSELPLSALAFNNIADPSGLRALRGLTKLSLDQRFPGGPLHDHLPPDAHLEYLYLGRDTLATVGLRGLGHWPTLTTLDLDRLDTPLSTRDWPEVQHLPALRNLTLTGSLDGYAVEAMPELPTVEHLRLPTQGGARDQLRTLASRLPALRTVTIKTYGRKVPLDLYASFFPTAEVADDRL
jgi:hypothetical protein